MPPGLCIEGGEREGGGEESSRGQGQHCRHFGVDRSAILVS
jgi:hypothetical protein